MELGVLSEGLCDHHMYYTYDFAGHSPSSDTDLSFSFDSIAPFDLGLDSAWSTFPSPKKELEFTNQQLPTTQWLQEPEILTPSLTPSFTPSPPASPESPSRPPRGKRRKLDVDREVVSYTPPSTPPYVTSNGQPRLDLTREELLALTSDQFEGLVAQVRLGRDLTPSEKREVKKQRRLIKNRESAHASRQRKKDYVSELEKKLADMAKENLLLTQAMEAVKKENSMLRAERLGKGNNSALLPETIQRGVCFLEQQYLQQQQQLLEGGGFPQHLSSSFPSHRLSPSSLAEMAASGPGKRKRGNNKTGVLLMVLLFSFGVMFGNVGFPTAGEKSSESRKEDATAEVPRVYKREAYKPLSRSPSTYMPDVISEEAKDEVPELVKQRLRKRMTMDPLPTLKKEEAPAELPTHVTATTSNGGSGSGNGNSVVVDIIPQLNKLDSSFFQDKTTYLVCEQIHKYDPPVPPVKDESATGGSQKLSFLIPPSSLDATNQDSTNLLVVTCEVTAVTLLPLVGAT